MVEKARPSRRGTTGQRSTEELDKDDEEADEQRIADMSAAKHRIVDHIFGLMAAMFSRRGEAR